MRRLLIIVTAVTVISLAAASLTGCAGKRKPDTDKGAMLSNLPFVYKMTVQQGNLVTEDMVNRLQIGMTRPQVTYVLGTPLLTDIFHNDRWDYPYSIKRGHKPTEERKLTLYFDGDYLARIEGHAEPNPDGLGNLDANQEIVVEVPDWKDNRGLVNKTLNAVGVKTKD